MTHYDAIIVGGGQSGLATAHHLHSRTGFSHYGDLAARCRFQGSALNPSTSTPVAR